jgi:hypothetical protein
MVILGLAFVCNLIFFVITLFFVTNFFELIHVNYLIIFIYYGSFSIFLILLGFITPVYRIKVLIEKKDKADQNIIYLINKNNFANLKLNIFFIITSDKKFDIIAHNKSILIINKDCCDLDYLGLEVYIKEQMINLLYNLENKRHAFIFIIAPIKLFYFSCSFLLKKIRFMLIKVNQISNINRSNYSLSILLILISLFLVFILLLLSPIIIVTYLFNYLVIFLEKIILNKYNNLIKKYYKVLY